MGLDSFHEECGVVGIFGHPEASTLTYLALYQLQHRGQEGAGIVSSDGHTLHSHRSLGLVSDVFDEEVLTQLTGNMALGHVRYSTSGQSLLKNVQPLVKDYKHGGVATSHNGNLTNALKLRRDLEDTGAMFQSTSDTEVIVHLLARSREENFVDRVAEALRVVQGAYSIVFMSETEMVAARDPRGFRPLILGKLGDATIIASETCALDLIEAKYIREILPGELLHIKKGQEPKSYFPWPKAPVSPCIFEHIYFARPDSLVFGADVYAVRKELGHQLAR